jgi:hypothetical protein
VQFDIKEGVAASRAFVFDNRAHRFAGSVCAPGSAQCASMQHSECRTVRVASASSEIAARVKLYPLMGLLGYISMYNTNVLVLFLLTPDT